MSPLTRCLYVRVFVQEATTKLLPVFDEFLDSAPSTQNFDSVRQSVVILMGSLAKHLSKTDPKVKPIVTKLIQALDTPSEQVNSADTVRWDGSGLVRTVSAASFMGDQ